MDKEPLNNKDKEYTTKDVLSFLVYEIISIRNMKDFKRVVKLYNSNIKNKLFKKDTE